MRHGLSNMQVPPKETASHPAKIVQPEAIVLDPSMSTTEAFVAVARGCIAHIAAAAAAAQCSDDPESIHQLRVGIRRLRAAFSVFSPAMPRRRPAVLRQSRVLQQQLGAARELDVLLDETIASMPDELRNRHGMREFIRSAEANRVARHRRAREALVSTRCTELLVQLRPEICNFRCRSGHDRRLYAGANGPAGPTCKGRLNRADRRAKPRPDIELGSCEWIVGPSEAASCVAMLMRFGALEPAISISPFELDQVLLANAAYVGFNIVVSHEESHMNSISQRGCELSASVAIPPDNRCITCGLQARADGQQGKPGERGTQSFAAA
jgi:hypothetical protein